MPVLPARVEGIEGGVIERAVVLWSNPGDMVFSPFAGIGSEGYKSLQLGRLFTGVELKPSYWELAKKNLSSAMSQTQDMFSSVNENEDMPARKVS